MPILDANIVISVVGTQNGNGLTDGLTERQTLCYFSQNLGEISKNELTLYIVLGTSLLLASPASTSAVILFSMATVFNRLSGENISL